MKAIIPLNIVALRVSYNDACSKTSKFQRRVANFNTTSTRDSYIEPLESDNQIGDSLKAGIHLHWELPDYFRKGAHKIDKAEIVFPQAPNRWLVVRYLSMYDTENDCWESSPSTKVWIVESDYISPKQIYYTSPGKKGKRSSIPVPVPVPVPGSKPVRIQSFSYMGRVIEREDFFNVKNTKGQYLKDFKDKDGNPLYLTSIGFLGPTFASSYPECHSVFGFWDNFEDNDSIKDALDHNNKIKFNVSYRVIGWIEDGDDPLSGVTEQIIRDYNTYLDKCKAQNVDIDIYPETMFIEHAEFNFGWTFDKEQIVATFDDSAKLTGLTVPEKSICNGIIQEIVFDTDSETSYILTSDHKQGVMISNQIKLAIGNTSEDAISAFLKNDQNKKSTDEYSLNTLQLESLDLLDNQADKAAKLDETMHRNGFSRINGGMSWSVQKKEEAKKEKDTAKTIEPASLSLELAEKLSKLNVAQKKYDFARQALETIRSQFFMDWFRFANMKQGGLSEKESEFLNTVSSFLSSELIKIKKVEDETGLLSYVLPNNSDNLTIKKLDETGTLAYDVWNYYQDLEDKLKGYLKLNWDVIAIPAPEFYAPSDLVTVMQNDYLGAALRNGKDATVFIRTSNQLINTLDIHLNNILFKVVKADEVYPFTLVDDFPYQEVINDLLMESALLMPILTDAIVEFVKPEKDADFAHELRKLQGGLNDQEESIHASKRIGLFERVREVGCNFKKETRKEAEKNPTLGDNSLKVTFRNDKTDAIAPNAIEWEKQRYISSISDAGYHENFVPLSIVWSINLTPLIQQNKQIDEYTFKFYDENIIATKFKLNDERTDYTYRKEKDIVTPEVDTVVFKGSTIMSKKTTKGLTNKIEGFIANNKNSNKAEELLRKYEKEDVLSNTISGLNDFKILKEYKHTVKIKDLKNPERDFLRSKIYAAAIRNPEDNWFDNNFHSVLPIYNSSSNFAPLSGGFLSFKELKVIDIFGQRIIMSHNGDDKLDISPAKALRPIPRHPKLVYLPPRFTMPTRLWFRYLNAEAGFTEMNSNLSSSPICGWVMLNNVDHCLCFYNIDGVDIGSFRYEREGVKYRTAYRNTSKNPDDDLDVDLKPENGVNSHTADFMKYINNKCTGGSNPFLSNLMNSILDSQKFLNSHNSAYSSSLSVFAGNPLALVRSVVSLESSGGVLPLDQSNTEDRSPFFSYVKQEKERLKEGGVSYEKRMKNGSAGVGDIKVPLHLGKLNGLDDGLIGYLIENDKSPIYDGDFYMPNIPNSLDRGIGIIKPGVLSESPLQLKLNAPELTLTMLVDPRAEVHAATSLLPEGKLTIPPGQYMEALDSLVMNFEMRPVLKPIGDFNIPLSTHNEHQWYWCEPNTDVETLLESNSIKANQWGYSPQTIKEGWVFLKKIKRNNN